MSADASWVLSLNDKRVSFIIVTYNSESTIVACLKSVLDQSLGSVDILILDNGSHDNTLRIVRKLYPQVSVIENGKNLGYAAANNIGVKTAEGEFICILNPDVILDSRWGTQIVGFLSSTETCGAAEGKLLMAQDPHLLNSGGSRINATGFGCATGLGQPDFTEPQPNVVSYPSGAAFAVRREVFLNLGGFDESYFMYHEDVDFGIRLFMAGWSVYFVPSALAFHHYDPTIRDHKMKLLEKNRWKTLAKDFPAEYLIRSLPLLVATELFVVLVMLRLGCFGSKWKAMIEFFQEFHQTFKKRVPQISHRDIRQILSDDVPMENWHRQDTAKMARKFLRNYRSAFLAYEFE